jgi:hypothetical protein
MLVRQSRGRGQRSQALLLIAAAGLLALSACDTAATAHPATPIGASPSRTPTSATTGATAAVAVTPPSGPAGLAAVWVGNQNQLELVDGHGHVVASTTDKSKGRALFRDPVDTTLGSGDADLMPYFTASRDRLYFLDGDTEVWALAPGTGARLVKHLPVGNLQHAGFAVSSDDKTIAVAIVDYSVTPHRLRVYTEDLANSGGHREVLSSTRRFEWPVGFVGTSILMAVGPTGSQSGSGDPYNAQYGYDLLAANGSRVHSFCVPPPATPGAGPAYGTAWGPVDAAGAICSSASGHVLESWGGMSTPLPDQACGGMQAVAYSPDRTMVMCVDPPNPTATTYHLSVVTTDGHEVAHWLLPQRGGADRSWVDEGHLIVDDNILDVVHNSMTPLPANASLVAVVPGDVY